MFFDFHEVHEYFIKILFFYAYAWVLNLNCKFNIAIWHHFFIYRHWACIYDLIGDATFVAAVKLHIWVFNNTVTVLNFKQNNPYDYLLTLISKFNSIW